MIVHYVIYIRASTWYQSFLNVEGLWSFICLLKVVEYARTVLCKKFRIKAKKCPLNLSDYGMDTWYSSSQSRAKGTNLPEPKQIKALNKMEKNYWQINVLNKLILPLSLDRLPYGPPYQMGMNRLPIRPLFVSRLFLCGSQVTKGIRMANVIIALHHGFINLKES